MVAETDEGEHGHLRPSLALSGNSLRAFAPSQFSFARLAGGFESRRGVLVPALATRSQTHPKQPSRIRLND